jgi:uncharacterized spore protein YtfJ
MTEEQHIETDAKLKAELNGEIPSVEVDVTPTTGVLDRVIEGTIGKALRHVNAHTVFGDPVTQADRTVIPVARVTANYGFGAGSGRSNDEEDNPTGSGGGGGGRVKATAIGYIEMTPGAARFVPILDRSAMITSLASFAGFALLLTLPRLIRRRL